MARRSHGIVLATLGVASLSWPALAEQDTVGVAAEVNPDVTAQAPNGQQRELLVGHDVIHNEKIATGNGGQAQLLFTDQSTLTVAKNSEVVIDDFVFDPQKQNGNLTATLTTGVFRYVGGKISKQQDVTFYTPTGTVSVRGGIALIKIDGNTLTVVFLHGDYANVTSHGVTKEMHRRNTMVVVNDKGISEPGPATAELIEELTQQLEALHLTTYTVGNEIIVSGPLLALFTTIVPVIKYDQSTAPNFIPHSTTASPPPPPPPSPPHSPPPSPPSPPPPSPPQHHAHHHHHHDHDFCFGDDHRHHRHHDKDDHKYTHDDHHHHGHDRDHHFAWDDRDHHGRHDHWAWHDDRDHDRHGPHHWAWNDKGDLALVDATTVNGGSGPHDKDHHDRHDHWAWNDHRRDHDDRWARDGRDHRGRHDRDHHDHFAWDDHRRDHDRHDHWAWKDHDHRDRHDHWAWHDDRDHGHRGPHHWAWNDKGDQALFDTTTVTGGSGPTDKGHHDRHDHWARDDRDHHGRHDRDHHDHFAWDDHRRDHDRHDHWAWKDHDHRDRHDHWAWHDDRDHGRHGPHHWAWNDKGDQALFGTATVTGGSGPTDKGHHDRHDHFGWNDHRRDHDDRWARDDRDHHDRHDHFAWNDHRRDHDDRWARDDRDHYDRHDHFAWKDHHHGDDHDHLVVWNEHEHRDFDKGDKDPKGGPHHFDHYVFDEHEHHDFDKGAKGDKDAKGGPHSWDHYAWDEHDRHDHGKDAKGGPRHGDDDHWHLHQEYQIDHWRLGRDQGHDWHPVDPPHGDPPKHSGFDQYVLHDEPHGDPKWNHEAHADWRQFEKLAFNHFHEGIQHSWQQHLPHWAAVDHDHHEGGPGGHNHPHSTSGHR